ncbi:MAG: hypothetical protein ACRD93_04130 [Nitrososphaeraceae archaeon]
MTSTLPSECGRPIFIISYSLFTLSISHVPYADGDKDLIGNAINGYVSWTG